jgi:hypothetical protein
MQKITRAQAMAEGLKRYFTGEPCSRGHIDERRVSSFSCLTCHRENQRALLAADPEFKRRQLAASMRWKATPSGRKAVAEHQAKRGPRDPEKERVRLRLLARRKRSTDPKYRLKMAISGHIGRVIRKAGKSTSVVLQERCGYTVQELMQHLERQFLAGMSWASYGRNGWHVDHVRPVADFDLQEPAEFAACWSLANLRPMWATDNRRKSAKLLFLL